MTPEEAAVVQCLDEVLSIVTQAAEGRTTDGAFLGPYDALGMISSLASDARAILALGEAVDDDRTWHPDRIGDARRRR